eukprot:3516327-Prymnesium_polylepis.1
MVTCALQPMPCWERRGAVPTCRLVEVDMKARSVPPLQPHVASCQTSMAIGQQPTSSQLAAN